MELHSEKNERRRRKIVQKTVILVRSVKPGQSSTQIWEKENTAMNSIWKN